MAPGSETLSVNVTNNVLSLHRLYVHFCCTYRAHAHNPQSLESLKVWREKAGNLWQQALYPRTQVWVQRSVLLQSYPKDYIFIPLLWALHSNCNSYNVWNQFMKTWAILPLLQQCTSIIGLNSGSKNYLQNIPNVWRDLQTKKTSRKLRQDVAWCRLRFSTRCLTLLQLPLDPK